MSSARSEYIAQTRRQMRSPPQGHTPFQHTRAQPTSPLASAQRPSNGRASAAFPWERNRDFVDRTRCCLIEDRGASAICHCGREGLLSCVCCQEVWAWVSVAGHCPGRHHYRHHHRRIRHLRLRRHLLRRRYCPPPRPFRPTLTPTPTPGCFPGCATWMRRGR